MSSVTGLAPVVALHLLMPVPQLLLTALAFVLVPVLGGDWLATAIAALAFLYADSLMAGSRDMHGVLRFFEGKGCLVTTFVPLAAGLIARFMRRGEGIDLAGLALVQVGAIGPSANGLYMIPAASGFVALVMPAGVAAAAGAVLSRADSRDHRAASSGAVALRGWARPRRSSSFASLPDGGRKDRCSLRRRRWRRCLSRSATPAAPPRSTCRWHWRRS